MDDQRVNERSPAMASPHRSSCVQEVSDVHSSDSHTLLKS
jgi:hypothetical protein